ncbi:MAG: TolC family protein [Bryobacteraceae bacterium]
MNTRLECEFAVLRQTVAAGLCCVLWHSCAWAQPPAIDPVKPAATVSLRPYVAPQIPPIRLNNSNSMKDMIRAGNLYLTVQDAIALVLENNIDIEVARYGPIAAVWQIQRAEAGEALPAAPSAAALVGSAAPGQGVLGSETAAGVTAAQGSGGGVSQSSNASVSSVGPVGQSLDPVFQEASVFSHASQPQFDTLLSLSPVLISSMRASSSTLQQGFLSGGSVALTYSDHYLNENATTDILNPSVAPNLSVSFQQLLLRGFGVAVNSRYITVAKINRRISDLLFKLQVINAVAQTVQLYYGLVADYEDVKAKQSSLELAQSLYADNKRQAQVGTLTALDVTSAEAQVAISQRDLLISETSLQQQELQLENLISRTGSADPLLRDVQIIPLDRIVIPPNDELPPIETMVQQALANRADLAAEQAEIDSAEVAALGSKSGLLPGLQVFGGEADAGLAGTPRTITFRKITESANPFFVGGTGAALGQVFRRDFPADHIGARFEAPIFNRQAQADYAADRISIRQAQLVNAKNINQVQVDLMSATVELQQARSRYETAVKTRMLDKQLLDSERKSYAVGKSTPFNVMTMQRNLATAEDAELASMVAWNTAVIELDIARGTTLETNHVSIGEAKGGKVARPATPR